MFRHLLVPLDGSRLAESVLPVAARLARQDNAALTIVHVIERKAPSAVHSDRHLVSADQAAAYLEEVARRPALEGLTVRTHVHTAEVKDVARSITQHTEELAPDLVVMNTHGRGGARRLLFGAIAQQVISLGQTPVLLLRPNEHAEPGTPGRGSTPPLAAAPWRTILAPVDGDPAHERGLPLAADMALDFHSRLHLLMVVPTIGRLAGFQAAAAMLLPGATRVKLEMEIAGAREYLLQRSEELRRRGVNATGEVTRGDPARAIARAARRLSADLVVMGTHGRAGTDAFWAGSVAARVVARTRTPLLLVPLREEPDAG